MQTMEIEEDLGTARRRREEEEGRKVGKNAWRQQRKERKEGR